MNLFRSSSPPSRVPTLTEVVDLVPVEDGEVPSPALSPAPAARVVQAEAGGGPREPNADETPAVAPRTDVAVAEALAGGGANVATHYGEALPSHEELVKEIMGDIQRQIDAMLEVRMKETLAPAITRFTDALARDTKAELGSVLKDVVTRSVTQALTKSRVK